MCTDARRRWFFRHRPASLESFSKWLGGEQLKPLRRFDKPNRRQRDIGLLGFVWLGLLTAAHAHMRSLEEIFKQIGKLIAEQTMLPVKLVTVPAFTQFRRSFPLRCLLRLWAALAAQVQQRMDCRYATWRGLRLWAMDGTGLVLPEALWPAFGSHGGRRGDGPAQAHLVVLYDLHGRVPVGVRVGPFDKSKERSLAPNLARRLGPGDLLLLDGGFYSIRLLGQLQAMGLKFVIPMRRNAKPKRIGRPVAGDGLYEIRASKRYRKETPDVPQTMAVRIVTACRKGFRARRLVTNLWDPEAFPAVEVAGVYHQRWHIETFYRELKDVLSVECWHARTAHGIYTELVFMMIPATLTRMAMAEAAGGACAPGALSFRRSLVWMRYGLAVSALLPTDRWPALCAQLLGEIRQCRIDVRPGRQYERDRQKRRKRSRAQRLPHLAGAPPMSLSSRHCS